VYRTFGVRYHRDYVGRLLREAGWSRQEPIERAMQRNDEAIEAWYEERWPAITKKADEEKYTILWVDEAGFYLLPMAVRTWAPRGADADPAGQADERSSFSDQWHHSGWEALHASSQDVL
jgi:hypothetical protein